MQTKRQRLEGPTRLLQQPQQQQQRREIAGQKQQIVHGATPCLSDPATDPKPGMGAQQIGPVHGVGSRGPSGVRMQPSLEDDGVYGSGSGQMGVFR